MTEHKRTTDHNILIAFLLNLCFSVFELLGGLYTGSVAILSDSVHDLGDAVSIGASWALEKKSKHRPDAVFTYGYTRYSVFGSVFSTGVLLVGSIVVILQSARRIFSPMPINYNGMIVLAVIGMAVNCGAAFLTREGDSLNQKAVNLHMLEDVLGWAVVLAGAILMRFTDIAVIDPLMSIGVSGYILYHTVRNLKESLDIFLEKTPSGVQIDDLSEHLLAIDGVEGIHHIHVWTMDGYAHCATLHAVTAADPQTVKAAIRQELAEHGIAHVTVEIERPGEICTEHECHTEDPPAAGHHHHHHHHHA